MTIPPPEESLAAPNLSQALSGAVSHQNVVAMSAPFDVLFPNELDL